MKITMSIKNIFTAFYSNRYLTILMTLVFALLLFPLGINRNRIFIVFITSLAVLVLYLIPQKNLRWVIFILFIFIMAFPRVSVPCTVLIDLNSQTCGRWETVSGKNVKKYHFKFLDMDKNRNRFGDIPLFLMIEGKKLENMDYSIKGAEIAGESVSYPYMADILMKIPIRKTDNTDMQLVLKARQGTEFQLFRGTEVYGRDLFMDAIYLMQENNTVRIIYYPELEGKFINTYPSYIYPPCKDKK